MCAYQIGHSQIGAKQKGAKYFFLKLCMVRINRKKL